MSFRLGRNLSENPERHNLSIQVLSGCDTISKFLEPLNPRPLESFDTFKNRINIVWLSH